MTVTVFTKYRCPQCEATKRQLTKQGIDFDVVDLAENPSTLEQLQQAGFRQAPVVITPDASWSGYRPDLIKQLAAQEIAAPRTAHSAASLSVPA
ncbi:glutaredoxin-like protein NrdH [Bifidobacterium sp.]|jgi:glutaredoxin-like protein NrdH|uniref:glutaredoxin-like protein NrdH n=1 Tax=Bifidobacterium sp. TaxID=41200 RepID=UPI0025C2584F|nr:glutaredoxin-like protein NrdH [Bifidobacterium sp.]MCH4209472.1 glutaredoxin-like protein NrdH [Bifidobacterium sp.]MCI1225135.1 glutaredoxin-like protein NrdH [Bifidobacterium sp.]